MRLSFKLLRAFAMQKFDHKVDYYKALNLSAQASPQQIKRAFKGLAKEYHPDANKGKEELFKQINQAYQILSQSALRKEYDEARREAARAHSQSHQSSQRQGYQQRYQQSREQPRHDYYSQKHQQPITQSQFRQRMRRRHQQAMKRAGQNRKDYDDLGRTYSNYQAFAQDLLRKKAQKQPFAQTDTVTQQSVRRQEELKREEMRRREEKQAARRREQLKEAVRDKYDRALHNSQNMVEGAKQMGQFLKDLFSKK